MKIGDFVQISLLSGDLSKGDNKTLTLVIIEVKWRVKEPPSCKLAHRILQMEN